MIICFGDNAIKPSPFGMVVKLPQYLMWIAELEDLARLGRGTFSAWMCSQPGSNRNIAPRSLW